LQDTTNTHVETHVLLSELPPMTTEALSLLWFRRAPLGVACSG
jgi:hypothetical protein